MGKSARKKLFLDKSRIWNFTTNTRQRAHLKSYTFGYFFHDDIGLYRYNYSTKRLVHEVL